MIVESAYGIGVGSVFLAAVPLALVTLIAVIFLPNGALGTQNAIQRAKAEQSGATGAGAAAAAASADAEDELTRELEDAEDAAIDAAAASVALAPVGLAHDPSTGSVATVDARPARSRQPARAPNRITA